MTDDKSLYRFDVSANSITKVGDYNCLSTANGGHAMSSIALDSAGNLYGTTFKYYPPGQGSNAFVKINRTNATCTFVHWTTNSLYATGMAFLPAGMVDTTEALVAIDNGEYYQIDPTNGDITHLGDFAGSGQQTTYLAEGGLTAANGKAYTRAFVSASGYLQVAEFDPVLGHFKRLLAVNNFPDRCLSLFRLGNALYTYGSKTGSTDKFFKIDLTTEKLTAMPNPTGVTTLFEPSVAVAPTVP